MYSEQSETQVRPPSHPSGGHGGHFGPPSHHGGPGPGPGFGHGHGHGGGGLGGLPYWLPFALAPYLAPKPVYPYYPYPQPYYPYPPYGTYPPYQGYPQYPATPYGITSTGVTNP